VNCARRCCSPNVPETIPRPRYSCASGCCTEEGFLVKCATRCCSPKVPATIPMPRYSCATGSWMLERAQLVDTISRERATIVCREDPNERIIMVTSTWSMGVSMTSVSWAPFRHYFMQRQNAQSNGEIPQWRGVLGRHRTCRIRSSVIMDAARDHGHSCHCHKPISP